jgi:hypothetical protein
MDCVDVWESMTSFRVVCDFNFYYKKKGFPRFSLLFSIFFFLFLLTNTLREPTPSGQGAG